MASFLRQQYVRLLTWYFRKVPVPHSFRAVVSDAPGTIVITQSESAVVEALLRSFALRSSLHGLQALTAGKAPIRTLLCWGSLHRNSFFDAIKACGPDQSFSTITIFSLRGPVKSNPSYRMSLFDLFLVVVLTRSSAIVFGTPFTLSEMERSGRRSPLRRIRLDFYKNLKLVRGIPFQSTEEQARLIIESPEFERELKLYSEKSRTPLPAARRAAYQEFSRLAANPLRPMYSILGVLSQFLLKRLFSQVIVQGLERLIPAVREETVVLVPMHRSHIDYIVLTSTLYDSHLNTPIVAAGMNLNFWPGGFLMRSVGAYFVRRDARQDRIHAMLLRHYVSYLVKRGHLQEFFIEGGRSRSGKMLAPKVGLLSIIVNTALKHRKNDTLFVPVSVTYENVVEDAVFGDENTGRPKKRENVIELLKAGSIFRKSYGDVIMNFGEPIPLSVAHREFMHQRGDRDERLFVPHLAGTLIRKIREQTNPSLMSLAYTALMMAPRYGLTRPELVRVTRNLAKVIELGRTISPSIGDPTPSLQAFLGGKEALLPEVARQGVIEIDQCGLEEVYFIPGAKRFTADFYRNSTLHLFFMMSVLSIVDLTAEEITVDAVLPYYQIFESDLLLDSREAFEEETRRWIELLREHAILGELSGKLRFVNRAHGIFCPGILLAPLHSLAFAVTQLSIHSTDEVAPSSLRREGGKLAYAELIRRIQNEARAARYLGLLSRTEAASKTSLTSTFETLARLGVVRLREESATRGTVELVGADLPILKVIFDANSAITQWMTSQSLREERDAGR